MSYLAVPQSSVAAAGRALQFMISELTEVAKKMPDDHPAKEKVQEEIFLMMDANKAMFSALPVSGPGDEKSKKT